MNMNKQILLEINRLRELMSLSDFQNENLINEQMAQVLSGLDRTIGTRWLSSIMSEYINRLINTSIENAGKAIDPDTFIRDNLDNVFKEVEIKIGNPLTPAEKNTIDAKMRVEIAKLVQAANKKAPTKAAKNLTKQAQKDVVDKLATRQPGQFTKQTTSQAIESSTTAEAKSVAENLLNLKRLPASRGWKAIKEHFKKNYGKYITAAGITALAVYFYIYGEDAEVPVDAEEYTDDTGGTGGGTNEEGVYTTPGDPYQYKVIECVWHTKGGPNKIKEWKSLAGNDNANAILDKRHPQAKQGCTPKPTEETPPAPSPTTEPAPEIAGEPNYIYPNELDRPQVPPVQSLPLRKSYVTPQP